MKDSGDDWSPSSASGSETDGDATDVIYEVEYEIASDSDSTDEIDSGSDDSDDDIQVSCLFFLLFNIHTNLNYFFFILGCYFAYHCL